jgi:hypothetical protein
MESIALAALPRENGSGSELDSEPDSEPDSDHEFTTTTSVEGVAKEHGNEVPFRLRCAICDRLAVNAYQLPCCEETICDSCK